MNQCQRTLETLLFGQPDRVPLEPGTGRQSTLRVWHAQGLPAELNTAHEIAEYAYRLVAGTEPWPLADEDLAVSERMIPQFEEKVLSRGERTQIVQDWKGNICEISNEFTTEYLRKAIDFVTRRWIKCPVESWDDWESMKERYDPDAPARLPDDPEMWGRRLRAREHLASVQWSGPFWQMREWLGFERLCMSFYDDPRMVRDMVRFWEEYIGLLLKRVLRYVTPDVLYFSEDMAYKQFAMISPQMTRDFLLPTYRRWGEIARQAGIPLYAIDSDGYVGQLIPVWIEAGVNVCDPVEVAALNDIAEYRRLYGKAMAFRGGVDKRAIAKGGADIEEEVARLRPVIRSGGYIPTCDHGIPSDVSWPNYVTFVKLLAQATGWL